MALLVGYLGLGSRGTSLCRKSKLDREYDLLLFPFHQFPSVEFCPIAEVAFGEKAGIGLKENDAGRPVEASAFLIKLSIKGLVFISWIGFNGKAGVLENSFLNKSGGSFFAAIFFPSAASHLICRKHKLVVTYQ